MNKFLIGGAAAAAVLVGGTAFAQAAQPTPAAPNGHQGRAAQPVTRADVQARVAKAFAKLDTNHDGFISKDEANALEQRRQQAAEQRAERFDPSKTFDRLDLNHDGKITLAEAQAARSQHSEGTPGQPAKAQATAFKGLFARADVNKDNVITRAEFDAMGQQIKARMEKAATTKGEMRMFDQADANKDGKVSLAEMQQAALTRFDRMDLNHDGKITPEERQQARQLLRSQKHPS